MSDAEEIARVNVASWQSAYAGIVPDRFLDSLSIERSKHEWRERINKGESKVFVVEQMGTIAGFVSFGKNRDENRTGEIYAVYVDPSSFRQGLGRMLCEHAMDDLRLNGTTEVVLWVLEDNDRARRFYERMGFVLDGKVKTEEFDDVDLPVCRYRRKL